VIPPGSWHCLTETATEEWARLSDRGASQPYFHLVAHGIFGLVLDRFGGGRGLNARLFFTLNADLRIEHAMTRDQVLHVHIQPIRRTEKVIETGISVVDAVSGERLAFCHHTGAYINRETRRIDPLGEPAMKLWDDQASNELSIEIMEPLEIKPRGERCVQSFDGVIEPEWIDRMGHMGIEHYGLIMDRGARFARGAMDPPLSSTLPKRIQVRYLKEIQLRQPFCVLSWVPSDAEMPIRMEHELWSGTFSSPGELAARCVEEAAAPTVR